MTHKSPLRAEIIHKHMTWAFYCTAACVYGNFARFKIQKHMTTIDKYKHASIHMSILLYKGHSCCSQTICENESGVILGLKS